MLAFLRLPKKTIVTNQMRDHTTTPLPALTNSPQELHKSSDKKLSSCPPLIVSTEKIRHNTQEIASHMEHVMLMDHYDDIFIGMSAPVTSREEVVREKMSHENTAREENSSSSGSHPDASTLLHKNNQSNSSFDLDSSELYDVVSPLKHGIRRNAMDSHDIRRIENLRNVFTEPIFERYRKQQQPTSHVVDQNSLLLMKKSVDSKMNSNRFDNSSMTTQSLSVSSSCNDLDQMADTDDNNSTVSNSVPLVDKSESDSADLRSTTEHDVNNEVPCPHHYLIIIIN